MHKRLTGCLGDQPVAGGIQLALQFARLSARGADVVVFSEFPATARLVWRLCAGGFIEESTITRGNL